jgi:hypothetical protein
MPSAAVVTISGLLTAVLRCSPRSPRPAVELACRLPCSLLCAEIRSASRPMSSRLSRSAPVDQETATTLPCCSRSATHAAAQCPFLSGRCGARRSRPSRERRRSLMRIRSGRGWSWHRSRYSPAQLGTGRSAESSCCQADQVMPCQDGPCVSACRASLTKRFLRSQTGLGQGTCSVHFLRAQLATQREAGTVSSAPKAPIPYSAGHIAGSTWLSADYLFGAWPSHI